MPDDATARDNPASGSLGGWIWRRDRRQNAAAVRGYGRPVSLR
jgi:hypothetical protein